MDARGVWERRGSRGTGNSWPDPVGICSPSPKWGHPWAACGKFRRSVAGLLSLMCLLSIQVEMPSRHQEQEKRASKKTRSRLGEQARVGTDQRGDMRAIILNCWSTLQGYFYIKGFLLTWKGKGFIWGKYKISKK